MRLIKTFALMLLLAGVVFAQTKFSSETYNFAAVFPGDVQQTKLDATGVQFTSYSSDYTFSAMVQYIPLSDAEKAALGTPTKPYWEAFAGVVAQTSGFRLYNCTMSTFSGYSSYTCDLSGTNAAKVNLEGSLRLIYRDDAIYTSAALRSDASREPDVIAFQGSFHFLK